MDEKNFIKEKIVGQKVSWKKWTVRTPSGQEGRERKGNSSLYGRGKYGSGKQHGRNRGNRGCGTVRDSEI